MDNLTHALVGAALSKSGLQRATPLATATLVIAANAPDVDVLAYTQDRWFAIAFRRGLTHGVPAVVVLPWLVAGALMAWDRWVRRRRHPEATPARFSYLLLLSYIGVLTHPALDWMNTYGMRWWLPFDGRWSYGDSLFIIDPWLWLLLGAAVALARPGSPPDSRKAAAGWLALTLVASWIVLGTAVVPGTGKVVWIVSVASVVLARALGRPSTPEGGRRLARGLTAAAAGYVALMVASHHAAIADVRATLEQARVTDAQAIMVGPRPADPLSSDLVVETAERYSYGTHDWAASPRARLTGDAGIPKIDIAPGVTAADAGAAVAAAIARPDVARYLVWSRFPRWAVEPGPGGLSVSVNDARYPTPGGIGGPTVVIPMPIPRPGTSTP